MSIQDTANQTVCFEVEVFEMLFNYLIYDGEQVIKPNS